MSFWDFMVGGDADTNIFGEVGSIIIIVLAFAIAIGGFVALAIANRKNQFNTQSIVFGAITMALSFGLSYVKFFELPQGGTVTLASLLPIAIYAYIFGFSRGIMVGITYSTLQIIQNPWIINFAQILLDYYIPFTAIAIIGLVPLLTKRLKTSKNKVVKNIFKFDLAIAMVIFSIVRYASHVISGTIFFSTWNPYADKSALVYSMIYNSFVFVDIAIAMIPTIALQFSKQFDRLCFTVKSELAPKRVHLISEQAAINENFQKPTNTVSDITDNNIN